MLGIMGNIDQQVNDKADSMQIQGKTSTVSKDLLDVMATQKIAREKETAMKELQMAQQQNPNTIKDQLEQKVMGMTQGEMTNQTAGILAQRAQQQQGKPQQRRPQQGGIAGARPPMGGAPRPPMGGAPRPPMGGAPKPPMGGAPRPPMGGLPTMGGARPPMMASGGIVAFQEGGSTSQKQRLINELKELRARREKESLMSQTSALLMQRINQKEAELKAITDAEAATAQTTTTPPKVEKGGSEDMMSQILSGMANKTAESPIMDTEAMLKKVDTTGALTPEQKTSINPQMATDAVDKETMSTLQDMSKKDVYGTGGVQDLAQQRFDKRYDIADLDKGQDPKTGEMGLKGLQDDLAKEQDRQMSPEVQRAQMLQDMRAGSGLGRRIADSSRSQNEKTLEFKQDKIDQYKSRFDTKLNALEKSDAQVAKAVELSQNTKVAALQSLANLGGKHAELALGQTQMYLEQNANRIASKLKAIGISEQTNLRMQLAREGSKEKILSLLSRLDEVRAEEKRLYLKEKQVELDNLDRSTVDGQTRYDQIVAEANNYAASVGEPARKLLLSSLGKLEGVDLDDGTFNEDTSNKSDIVPSGSLTQKGQSLVDRLKDK